MLIWSPYVPHLSCSLTGRSSPFTGSRPNSQAPRRPRNCPFLGEDPPAPPETWSSLPQPSQPSPPPPQPPPRLLEPAAACGSPGNLSQGHIKPSGLPNEGRTLLGGSSIQRLREETRQGLGSSPASITSHRHELGHVASPSSGWLPSPP